ncbi:tRNA N6-adenosine threonylcarbamoyltransferase, mitochondrial-like [Glandiceps talaboti]
MAAPMNAMCRTCFLKHYRSYWSHLPPKTSIFADIREQKFRVNTGCTPFVNSVQNNSKTRPDLSGVPSRQTSISTRGFRTSHHKSRRLVLGIETSCDETGAAVVNEDGQLLGESLHSQKDVHLKTGGIIPPVAQKLHQENIGRVVLDALDKSNVGFKDLSAVATTVMPGLALSLGVGLNYTKQLVQDTGLPFIPIHHMEAHALTVRMIERVDFPFLVFLVSGGHCILAVMRGLGDCLVLGQTLDTAPGESYDKVARRLQLDKHPECIGMSGGQAIEHLAKTGIHTYLQYRTPMVHHKNCSFSFSGLRTSTSHFVEQHEKLQGVDSPLLLSNISDIAASFQFRVTHQMVKKVARAMIYSQEENLISEENQTLVVSGGVASNSYIRKALQYLCDQYNYRLVCPPPKLCTDNGIMIAWAGMERLKQGIGIAEDPQNVRYEPRWPLGEDISESVAAARIPVPAIRFWKSSVH